MQKILAAAVVGAWGLFLSADIAAGQTATREAARPRAQPPTAFAACTACHTTIEGKNGFGPSLAGVAGRRAASLRNYTYSDALKNSGLIWNAANLDHWLTSPQRAVPGTKMPFPGIADPAKRKEVVDYLLAL